MKCLWTKNGEPSECYHNQDNMAVYLAIAIFLVYGYMTYDMYTYLYIIFALGVFIYVYKKVWSARVSKQYLFQLLLSLHFII